MCVVTLPWFVSCRSGRDSLALFLASRLVLPVRERLFVRITTSNRRVCHSFSQIRTDCLVQQHSLLLCVLSVSRRLSLSLVISRSIVISPAALFADKETPFAPLAFRSGTCLVYLVFLVRLVSLSCQPPHHPSPGFPRNEAMHLAHWHSVVHPDS